MSRQLLLRQYMHEICTSSWRTPLGSVEGTEHRKSCPRSKAPFSEKRVNPQCSLPRPSRKKWHILATACLSAALASGVATRAPCQKYVESRQAPRNSNPQRCTTLAFKKLTPSFAQVQQITSRMQGHWYTQLLEVGVQDGMMSSAANFTDVEVDGSTAIIRYSISAC